MAVSYEIDNVHAHCHNGSCEVVFDLVRDGWRTEWPERYAFDAKRPEGAVSAIVSPRVRALLRPTGAAAYGILATLCDELTEAANPVRRWPGPRISMLDFDPNTGRLVFWLARSSNPHSEAFYVFDPATGELALEREPRDGCGAINPTILAEPCRRAYPALAALLPPGGTVV